MNLKIFKGFERFKEEYPVDAVRYALDNQEEAIPELLYILDYALSDSDNLSVDGSFLLHFPAIYLLAHFREQKAFSRIINFLKLPGDVLFDFFEDSVTEDFKNILASTYNGDIDIIKEVVEDASLDEYARGEALDALLVLLAIDKIKRDDLVVYFKELFNGKLKDDNELVWETLYYSCCSIHPLELIEDIEKAITNGKIIEEDIDVNYQDEKLKKSIDEVIKELKEDENYEVINEADVMYLSSWLGKSDLEDDNDEDLAEVDMDGLYYDEESDEIVNIPYVRDNYVGRNDPCPCGSGKKYKKCCLK